MGCSITLSEELHRSRFLERPTSNNSPECLLVPLVLSSNLYRADIMRRFLVPVVGDLVVQQREARLAAVAANHQLTWPPEHVTPKRGRPTVDVAWVRALQRRLLADGDLPSDVTGKRPWWWQLGVDVDKNPLESDEVEAVIPCAAEEGRTEVHKCPVLNDWFLDFAGGNRAGNQWTMAHSLRVARRLCPLFEKIHDDAPRTWKHSSVPAFLRHG